MSNRKRRRSAAFAALPGLALAVLAALPHAAVGHEFDDDAGDTPAAALAIGVNDGGAAYALEIDIDTDWFVFPALPSVTYTVTIANVVLYDHAMALCQRQGSERLRSTGSLPAATSSTVVWSNDGCLANCYIGVSGAFEFTTGTYHLAVSHGMVDTDGDGLPDRWEIAYFDSLDEDADGDKDADGTFNGREFYLRTNPTNPADSFVITALLPQTNGALLKWNAVSGGWYRILAAANLPVGAQWSTIGTSTNDLVFPVRQFFDTQAGGWTGRFYRVELMP